MEHSEDDNPSQLYQGSSEGSLSFKTANSEFTDLVEDNVLDCAEQDLSYNDEFSSYGSSIQEERPNKFHGYSSTWCKHTEQDRLIYKSLNQLRNTDLAVHLFAAHSLKRRLRNPSSTFSPEPWKSKKSWIGPEPVTETGSNAGENENRFCPAKSWTAWPLNNELVPREGFVNWEDNPFNKFYNEPSVSNTLLDILVTLSLKAAKERFLARPDQDQTSVEPRVETRGDITSNSGVGTGGPSDGSTFPFRLVKPIIMADDIKAENILKPTIQHIIASFDKLLLALHQSRKSYARGIIKKPTRALNLNIGSVSGTSSNAPSVYQMGRDGENLSQEVRIPELPQNEEDDELSDSSPAAKGRKRKSKKKGKAGPVSSVESLESRLSQKSPTGLLKNPDLEVLPEQINPPPRPSRRRRYQAPPEVSAQFSFDRQLRLGLRDWSDILSMACLIGWDANAVLRASDRCSRLFGESMTFGVYGSDGNMIHSDSEAGKNSDSSGSQPQDARSSTARKSSEGEAAISIKKPRTYRKAAGPKAKSEDLFCPFEDCNRSRQGFSRRWNLKQHIKVRHGDKSDPKGSGSDAELGEMKDGVHVDGFLCPIPFIRGLKAKDNSGAKASTVSKRKREAKGQENGSDSETSSVGKTEAHKAVNGPKGFPFSSRYSGSSSDSIPESEFYSDPSD
ncbi:MAG: hypothetical protein M1829_001278 [Trizodia sp. TS-e1964]|nr:MAG: hypothetical protein M1829_001278 [Trizodia sp. TS-e1964]